MDDLSKAVVFGILAGQTDALVKCGMKPDWIQNADARALFSAAFSMEHQSIPKPVTKLNLLVATSGKLANAEDTKKVLEEADGFPIVVDDTSQSVRNSYLLRMAGKYTQKMQGLIRDDPRSVSQWLPTVATEMQATCRNGIAYNPSPDAHIGSIVAPVMFKSRLHAFNDYFAGRSGDGGGYRGGWWNVWLGHTGQGKSTHKTTIAWDCVSQGKKTAILSKENQPTERARVLWALTGLTGEEINHNICVDQGRCSWNEVEVHDENKRCIGQWWQKGARQYIMNKYVDLMREYLRLYSWDFFYNDGVPSIIATENPDVILIDYIDVSDITNQKENVAYGLGRISSYMEKVAHETGKSIHGYWQIAKGEMALYRKSKTHVIDGPYASGMVSNSADQMGQMRYDDLPDRQHIFKTKDRAADAFREYYLRFDRSRWVFTDDKQEATCADVRMV